MTRREWIRGLALVGLITVIVTLAGCVGPRVTEPMRAIWVTRFDYKTAEDVSRIVENCADAGFNAVLFQVRGNGTAFYQSNFEPWADELGGEDPGFDPLTVACDEAHARGIELHAYVNVMPAWRGTTPPTNPEQLYHQHPEWFWYDQHGERQKLSSFYVSLNPCLPEVREYIVDVFEDLAARYEIDGLHLDYIRFPNEHPAIPRGSGLDYPRDERTLALYQEQTGLAPDDDREAWNQWRTEQVTQLVVDIHKMLRRTRPEAVLTAAVGSVRERALDHYQDGRAWMDQGIMDAVILMDYTDSPEVFVGRIDPWLEDRPAVPVVPGLWFGRHPDKAACAAAGVVQEQIELARERTGNFCIFAYSSLFDSSDDELNRQDSKQSATRATRREVLLPYLQGLAEEDS
ncbi:MAG: family 10 glycosylhydrolase [Planctomycetota bacterium]